MPEGLQATHNLDLMEDSYSSGLFSLIALLVLVGCSVVPNDKGKNVFLSTYNNNDTIKVIGESYFRIMSGDTVAQGWCRMGVDDVILSNFHHDDIGHVKSLVAPLSRNNISGQPIRIIISQDLNIIYEKSK